VLEKQVGQTTEEVKKLVETVNENTAGIDTNTGDVASIRADTVVVFTFKELDIGTADLGLLEANLRTAIVELTPITQQTVALVAISFEAGSATAEFPTRASAKQARAKADDVVELATNPATTTTTTSTTTTAEPTSSGGSFEP